MKLAFEKKASATTHNGFALTLFLTKKDNSKHSGDYTHRLGIALRVHSEMGRIALA